MNDGVKHRKSGEDTIEESKLSEKEKKEIKEMQ